jgi:thioredoxin 1
MNVSFSDTKLSLFLFVKNFKASHVNPPCSLRPVYTRGANVFQRSNTFNKNETKMNTTRIRCKAHNDRKGGGQSFPLSAHKPHAAFFMSPATDQVEERCLPEISAENFWSAVDIESQDMRLVVVMCYTSTCIPCKAVKPQLIELSQIYKQSDKISFYQFELIHQNKDVAVQLGVRSSPTFVVFKNGVKFEIFRGSNTLPLLKKFLSANQ